MGKITDYLIPIAILVGTVALLVGFTLFITSSIFGPDERLDSFYKNCSRTEGHIYKPSTISFCVDDEGHFVEVYP